MSLFSDLLGDLLASGAGPSGDRSLVALFAVGSFLCGSGTVIAATISPGLFHSAPWAIGALVGSILGGAAGVMLSILHIVRNENERAFGSWCLGASIAGLLMPLMWLVAR